MKRHGSLVSDVSASHYLSSEVTNIMFGRRKSVTWKENDENRVNSGQDLAADQKSASAETRQRQTSTLIPTTQNASNTLKERLVKADPFFAPDVGSAEEKPSHLDANVQFRDAAHRLARLPLQPRSPPQILRRNDRMIQSPKSAKRTPKKLEVRNGPHHAASPRKLLWPNSQEPIGGSVSFIKRSIAPDFRQKAVPARKPRRSFTVHRSPTATEKLGPRSLPGTSGYHKSRYVPLNRVNVPTAAALSRRYGANHQQHRKVPINVDWNDENEQIGETQHKLPTQPKLLTEDDDKEKLKVPDAPEAVKSGEASVTEWVISDLIDATKLESPKRTEQDLRFYAARILPSWHVWTCRSVFGLIVILGNISLLLAYLHTNRHLYLLAILAFVKSKDLMSTIADIFGIIRTAIKRSVSSSHQPTTSKWILSLICAYAETDEQILKTAQSLIEQDLGIHKQVLCIILDGKNPDILSRFSKVHHKLKRTYFTWKGSRGELLVYSGFLGPTPTILIRKIRNAGKKDSLILGHDMFNYPRPDMPGDTLRLRREIFTHLLPVITGDEQLSSFDFVFCTDADSMIHPQSLRELANTLVRDENAIAACGILVAELIVPEVEWTIWHLYQQFQYTFGQYVRRQAEGLWGRVTCLPGCITMITVRPEMGTAISMYAHPVTNYNILEHQVQYLGTDRRLTYCILAQGTHLRSLFVPGALCETVVPDSLDHYLSQRRRWASNAYFNDYYYACGKNQRLVTRLFAVIDLVRQTLVFYRVINTALFVKSLVQRFYIAKIIPTLILTKTPAIYFMLLVLIREKVLRQRLHKLVLGMCINQMISPFLSVIVFANVLLNMGSQVWGTTGVSSVDPRHPATPYVAMPPENAWSPTRLASIVKTAISGNGSQQRSSSDPVTLRMNRAKDVARYRSKSMPTTPGAKPVLRASLVSSEIRHRTPGRTRSKM